MRKPIIAAIPFFLAMFAGSEATAQASPKSLRAELSSIGPIAFAPGHQLLVSDPKGATIYAFDVAEFSTKGISTEASVEDLGGKIADLIGGSREEINIVDLAVNPDDKQVYVSAQRGQGEDQELLLFRVQAKGEIEPVFIEELEFTSATLPNPPQPGEGRRARNRHLESITDMAFIDGQVVIAGLSNEEFSSKLRAIPFPFDQATSGASIEIFHGNHGAYETRSPVRTFVPYELEGEPVILAAYTCTPLVVIPIAELEDGKKVRGKTVAELGNRNRPLDMISYEKDGESFLLMANNNRGVMKINAVELETQEAITTEIPEGTAGVSYETIANLQGVTHLDKLDEKHAVVLISSESGKHLLRAVKLP
ncbi:MAG: hypothetical protein ACYTG5_23570 [Planctomycetota bacterium]|jgi:hypothetical protein